MFMLRNPCMSFHSPSLVTYMQRVPPAKPLATLCTKPQQCRINCPPHHHCPLPIWNSALQCSSIVLNLRPKAKPFINTWGTTKGHTVPTPSTSMGEALSSGSLSAQFDQLVWAGWNWALLIIWDWWWAHTDFCLVFFKICEELKKWVWEGTRRRRRNNKKAKDVGKSTWF